MTVDDEIQVGLAGFGLTALILVVLLDQPWGALFGLASQPFWFASALRARLPGGQARQWGVLVLTGAYGLVWLAATARWMLA